MKGVNAMSEALNIYQKLVEVRKSVPYLKKENEGQQFNYVSSSQIIGAVRQKLDEYCIFLEVRVLNREIVPFVEELDYKGQKKNRTTYRVDLDLEYVWINGENPTEKIISPFFASGLDIGDSSKAIGKALTYAEKYFFLKSFNIATDKDDADSFQERIEKTVVEIPSNSEKQQLLALATEFGALYNKTQAEVLASMHIKSVDSLSKKQIQEFTNSLTQWIQNESKKRGA